MHKDETKAYDCRKCFLGTEEILYWKYMAIWMKYMSVLWQLFFSFCEVVLAWHPCCQLRFSNALLFQTYFLLSGFQGQGILDAQRSWLNGLDVYTLVVEWQNDKPEGFRYT